LPGGGLGVLAVDAGGAVVLYVLREVLDGLAARLAAQRIDRAGLRALARSLRGMEAAVPRQNAHGWFVNHAAFHEQIFHSSGNGRALALVSHVRLSIQRFHQLLLKTPNRLQVALQEHTEIFRAIEAGRAEAAETVARRHIVNAREIVLQVLREQGLAAAAQGG
ncbi:MAG: GntR family transcriptional regulator, partial [SAR324 cluster bacterium]